MDSTMVYRLIQQHLKHPQELTNLLPTLAELIAPHSRLRTDRMSEQQVFAQVYNCVTAALDKRQEEKQQLLEGVEDDNQQEENGQAQEQDQEEGDIDQQEQAEYGQEEQEPIQEEEQAGMDEEQDAEEEQQNQKQDALDLMDEQAYEGQEDVGLYGEQIDEDQMESYQNEGNSQQEKQFEQEEKLIAKRKAKGKAKTAKADQDPKDDLIDDQFDHFRELQLKINEEQTHPQQPNDLQKQIAKLQGQVIDKKGWVLQGEVKGTQRPVNSLLEYDLQFSTGLRLNQQITPQYNEDLEKIIKQRILDELYDDRVRYQPSEALREQFGSLEQVSREKSKLGLAELYESDFKNYLGLGENKQDKLRTTILQAFKELNYSLDSLSNFHFTPRSNSKGKGEAVISEQKVPINTFRGGKSEQISTVNRAFLSEKQQDKKGKRLKNKRISRQRVKEQMKKKMNKKIEYGGMSKFEAKAVMKKTNNNLNATNIKYSKSANFFREMGKDKDRKPNPNINKLKV